MDDHDVISTLKTAPSFGTRLIIPTTGSQSASLIQVNMHRSDERRKVRETTNSKAVGALAHKGKRDCTQGRQIDTCPAMRRASQVVDIRKGLVASVATLLYASPRDFACSVNVFICVCMNSV